MDYGKRGLREGEGSCLLKRGRTEQRKGEAKILKGKGGKLGHGVGGGGGGWNPLTNYVMHLV